MPKKGSGRRDPVQMHIYCERSLRDTFIAAANANDRPAAQVIRDLMRGYVAENATVAA